MRKWVFTGLSLGFIVFLLAMTHLANIKADNIFFRITTVVPFGDKLGHFVLAGLLTFFLNGASNWKRFKLGKFRVLYGPVAVMFLAILDEGFQVAQANRTAGPADLLFDFLGIIVFSYWSVKFSKRLNPQQKM